MHLLDTTIDAMQNTRFLNIYHDIIRQMERQTEFNKTEISCILLIYHKLTTIHSRETKYLSKQQFSYLCTSFFQLSEKKIVDRVLAEMTVDSIGHVSPVKWVKLFDVFVTDDLEKKMRYVFNIYDESQDGFLSRAIMAQYILQQFPGEEEEIYELRTDLLEMLVRKFDRDRDGLVSYEDYSSVVRKSPELIEFLGRCTPDKFGLDCVIWCANLVSKITEGGKRISII